MRTHTIIYLPRNNMNYGQEAEEEEEEKHKQKSDKQTTNVRKSKRILIKKTRKKNEKRNVLLSLFE